MSAINVQFSDSTETVIVACFAVPQQASGWPNQSSIDTSDARWASFYNSQPSSVQPSLAAPG